MRGARVGPGTAHGMHGLLAGTAATILLAATFVSGAGAAEPATIPTAVASAAAPRCTVGQSCTFAAPIFVCDYAGAEKIAAAGPAKGGEIGAGLVRDTTCRTVAAGRPLGTEATKSGLIVYLTEGGQHLGYAPVGIFAPGGTASLAACDRTGFCAVRHGPPTYLCPQAADLALPTPEAKAAAKCLRISDSNAGEVTSVAGSTVTLANMYGGRAPYQSSYYAARAEFVALDLQPYPTPAARGWCRPDTWCVTVASTLFCSDRAAYERVEAMPFGEPRRIAIGGEPGCRIVVGGNALKPKEPPTAGDPTKLIEVEHPTLKTGWASADAFPVLAYSPPVRNTGRLADIAISEERSPDSSAIDLRGQGTGAATGVFRSGPRERRKFCEGYWGEDQAEGLKSCLSEPDATISVKANCEAKEVSFSGRRYGLFERPRDAAPDIHYDEHRQMLYRDLKSGEWLDGSTVSREMPVRIALTALCPGVDPEASYGLVYRDPQARYPRELWGRWFSDPLACADASRNQPDYDEYIWMTITERTEHMREGADTLSAIRRVGRDTWLIDSTSPSQEGTLNFLSTLYTLTRNGLETRSDDNKMGRRATRWVRCSR